MWNKLKLWWKQINDWLDARPTLHSLWVALETAALVVIMSEAYDWVMGNGAELSVAYFKSLWHLILAAEAVAFRNWIKQSPLFLKLLEQAKASPPEVPKADAAVQK